MKENTAHLTFHAKNIDDLINPCSVPGYEYVSVELVAFLERFRSIIPEKTPIVLEITDGSFTADEKKIIDGAIWMHFCLYLAETADQLKNILKRMFIFLIMMILSSACLFWVSDMTNEVVINYGYLLFWFFGYRLVTHLMLDCLPLYASYRWYRRLAAAKLIFKEDTKQVLDTMELSKEAAQHAREADRQIRTHRLVDHVFMEETCVALGCKISQAEECLLPSGAEGVEIISDDLTAYLTEALPFIKQDAVTKLEIEGGPFTEDEKKRITAAIRNQLSFIIADQEDEQKENTNTSIFFTIGLVAATLMLWFLGKGSNKAVHEFIMVLFWFFSDYLLELVLLSRTKLLSEKKVLEKLADMDITYKQ